MHANPDATIDSLSIPIVQAELLPEGRVRRPLYMSDTDAHAAMCHKDIFKRGSDSHSWFRN